MKTVICPKCNQIVVVIDSKKFTICCDELIYVSNNVSNDVSHDRKNERKNGVS